MKDAFTVVGIALAAVVFILGASWAFQGSDFFVYRYFAPKYEAVRRETFEGSKAYRQGLAQELQNMQFEYIKATPEQKQALASIILHRAADVPDDALPPDLASFVANLRKENMQ